MAFTTIDNSELFFQAKTYSGTGSSQSITFDGSENMQPDWIWIKSRSNAHGHNVADSVRGISNGGTKILVPDSSQLEETNASGQGIQTADSDGFTLGSETNTSGSTNGSGKTYISWNWKAGTSFTNDASATGVGTIDSSGSTSQTAGFSIVSWTGTGSAGTIAHNLGSIPKWYILKVRTGATNNWGVYHNKSNANPEQYALYLDQNTAATDDSGLANDTAPTSTVFSVTTGNYGNVSGRNYIGYFFSEVKGYSRFGAYVGNGNTDGPIVYTGFRPAWIMVKAIDAGKSWYMWDNKRSSRSGFNVMDDQLLADTNDAEFDGSNIDILSNGFKFRGSGSGEQGSGTKYIFMAFAESPFVNSNGVPNNAR